MDEAAIRAKMTKIGSNRDTLVITPGSWTIGQSIVVPANVHLRMEQGATLVIAKGATLSIQGAFEARGLSQIFTGEGKVRFGDGFTGEVFPQWWGAIRNVDDTAACQAALDSGAQTVRFPKATYAIDTVGAGGGHGLGLSPASNTKVLFDAGSMLRAIPNDKKHYTVLNLPGRTNVTIDGAVIRGERNAHAGQGGEWGHGIRICQESKNITIRNVDVADCWGDGIYLGEGTVDGIIVENSRFDNNRRNACSITNARNVLFKKCIFSGSNATSPFKGVDVEPNVASDVIHNIVFEGCTSTGNKSTGFSLARDDKQDTPVSVTFRDCTSVNDGGGFGIDIGPSDGTGFMNIINCSVISPKETGFRSASSNLHINIDGFYVYNPNQDKHDRPEYSSGLSFRNAHAHYQGRRKLTGNIDARNVYVEVDDGKATYALFSRNDLGENSGYQNLSVQLKTNLPNEKRFFKGIGPYYNYYRVDFPDNPTVNATGDMAGETMAAYVGQKITNAGADKDITVSLDNARATTFDSVYTFELAADHRMTIDFGKFSLLPVPAGKIWSDKSGSRLKVRSDGKNWYIVEQIGTWNTN